MSEKTSKLEHAYDWIYERIVQGQFGPGYRLVLSDIARDLGMSVVPVREAIRRLEAEGLITFERNVGARVNIVDETSYVETMQTLAVIEGSATALAAPHIDPEDLAHAEKVNQHLIVLLDDFDALLFTQLNQRFHELLYQSCPNAYLLDLVRRSWTQLPNLRFSTFGSVPERGAKSVVEHQEILALIRNHAPAGDIERAVREHRCKTVDSYLTRARAAFASEESSDMTPSIVADTAAPPTPDI